MTFDVATGEPHDASFPAARGVACSAGGAPAGLRIPSVPSATWSGSCTFSQPGYIPFVCTVHSDMTGEVAVAGEDGALPPRDPAAAVPPPVTGASWSPGTDPAPGAPALVDAAPLQPVFDVRADAARRRRARHDRQRGPRGRPRRSTSAPAAATSAPPAASRPARAVCAGSRAATDAGGSLTFAVTLDAIARRALTRRGRLALTMKATVRGPRIAGTTATRTQQVTLLRRPAHG